MSPRYLLLAVLALPSCEKKEQPVAPASTPPPAASAPQAAAPSPGPLTAPRVENVPQSSLEKAYRDSLAKDAAGNEAMKKLLMTGDRYRSQEPRRQELQQKITQWLASAPADDQAARQAAVDRIATLSGAMADVRAALDPTLVKLLQTDPEAAQKDLSARMKELGVRASLPKSSATNPLAAAYDSLAGDIQDQIISAKLPKELFPQEYLSLQMEAAIGRKIDDALAQKASPETRRLRDQWRAASNG